MNRAEIPDQVEELTYDDLWQAIEKSKSLYKKTRDPLLNSGIKLLASALTREDEPGAPIELTKLEQIAYNNLKACVEADDLLTWK